VGWLRRGVLCCVIGGILLGDTLLCEWVGLGPTGRGVW
jgi:hypothetical protein